MGVLATLCAVCGAPVNDDQYTDADRGAFRFGEGHAWLRDVIGLSLQPGGPRLEGEVRDQVLRAPDGAEAFVCDGVGAGDYLTLHRRCWELAEKPETTDALGNASGTAGWSLIAPYHQQLFDLHACAATDAWLLEDPFTEAGDNNLTRIRRILAEARSGAAAGPVAGPIAALIAADAWTWTRTRTSQAAVRDGAKGCDPSGYEHWVEVEKPYIAGDDGLPQPFVRDVVTAFTLKLQRAIEGDAVGVLVAITHTAGSSRYTIYAREAEACRARIESLAELHSPKPAEIEVTHDPDWSAF